MHPIFGVRASCWNLGECEHLAGIWGSAIAPETGSLARTQNVVTITFKI
ncbi:hypothetical protein J0895_11105 [Phormidium pseudopriestleyi FRX01]|uniref:Uncharacterized protein n=1 Tax=Phormidium pseudopriestleyi FRX01 TaxID=1759528 RepID=A0ABS3FRA7_9CYAN|nr:hypothetical protein [Phormidium pseudopriestleyi]MBO0349649.1 hypothetical protein [Phormidium pseudopriestleyi FRX01]